MLKNILAFVGAAFLLLSVGGFIAWIRGRDEKAKETFSKISIVIWGVLAVLGVVLIAARIWSFTLVSAMSAVEGLGISRPVAMLIIIISIPVIGLIVQLVKPVFEDRKRPRTR
jgi:hypothetical protein